MENEQLSQEQREAHTERSQQDCVCVARDVYNRNSSTGYTYSSTAVVVAVCTDVFFLGHLHGFLRRPWVFSHALVCGARRGPTCTPRSKFRTGSVARALGVQSREIWQIIAVTFRGARPEQHNVKPTCQPFCSTAFKARYFVAATVYSSIRTSSSRGPLLCVWTSHMRVCSVCAMI